MYSAVLVKCTHVCTLCKYAHTHTHTEQQTNMSAFSQPITEVYRSQGDFQWLYEALQEACPERIIPPLKPPISLDATMSEFQRFLSRISTHKTLRKQHHFCVFLTGTAEVCYAHFEHPFYMCIPSLIEVFFFIHNCRSFEA